MIVPIGRPHALWVCVAQAHGPGHELLRRPGPAHEHPRVQVPPGGLARGIVAADALSTVPRPSDLPQGAARLCGEHEVGVEEPVEVRPDAPRAGGVQDVRGVREHDEGVVGKALQGAGDAGQLAWNTRGMGPLSEAGRWVGANPSGEAERGGHFTPNEQRSVFVGGAAMGQGWSRHCRSAPRPSLLSQFITCSSGHWPRLCSKQFQVPVGGGGGGGGGGTDPFIRNNLTGFVVFRGYTFLRFPVQRLE